MIKIPGLLLATLILTSCGAGNSYSSDTDTQKEGYEMTNPYSDGTGHHAGYEWAERTGGDCNGSSASFNEGCEEYQHQLDLYESSQK